MKNVSIFKAQKGSHEIESVTISIDKELPYDSKGGWLERSQARFELEANKLFTALRDVLPGGTLDRLVGKLLAYKASHFIVTFEDHKISFEEWVKASGLPPIQDERILTWIKRAWVAGGKR